MSSTALGICSYDTCDANVNMDGTPDCTEGCRPDKAKIQPGIHGGGKMETETDIDETPKFQKIVTLRTRTRLVQDYVAVVLRIMFKTVMVHPNALNVPLTSTRLCQACVDAACLKWILMVTKPLTAMTHAPMIP